MSEEWRGVQRGPDGQISWSDAPSIGAPRYDGDPVDAEPIPIPAPQEIDETEKKVPPAKPKRKHTKKKAVAATKETPAKQSRGAQPQPQLSVREWALSQAGEVGIETALAFVSIYPNDTGTAEELEAALTEMRSRVVHQG